MCVSLLLASLTACAREPAPPFSAARARAHVERLAGQIGRRPTGSAANRQAREYLVETLRAAGFDVRIQEADARMTGGGRSARVANIIATPPGPARPVIALMAHYDSTPDGPAAADDGFGVAVCVEAGRALLAGQPRKVPIVILTDGEELGLMGAAAILDDPVRQRILAVLNFEAIGSAAPVMLFEAGRGSGPLLDAWRRGAPGPRGASFMTEIYRAISRGGDRTDLGLLRRAGIPGLDFALVGDGYTYHTPLDAAGRLDQRALARAGAQAVATITAIDVDRLAAASSARSEDEQLDAEATTYFDVLGVLAVAYGPQLEWLIAGLAVGVGLMAWGRIVLLAWRRHGAARLLLSLPWLLVGFAIVSLALVGGGWALRAAGESLHPWYAHPGLFYVWLALVAILVGWGLVQAGSRLPRRVRGSADALVVWAMTLPVWATITALGALVAPASAFLAAWPLLVAGVALLACPIARPLGMRAASLVAAAGIGALWLPNLLVLLAFVAPELDRTPLVTPLLLHPALLLAVAILLAPPVLAILSGLIARRGLALAVVGVATLLAFVAAWRAPAYTNERPLHHVIRYVADVAGGRAIWETGANEPALPVAGWRPGGAAVPGSPLAALAAPFVHHATAPPPGPAPFRVTGSIQDRDASLEILAVPRGPSWTVVFALPEGIVPLETSLPVTSWRGRRAAIFAAVPAEGVTFRARVSTADLNRLSSTAVVAIGPGLPGAEWPRLPAWLPQERDVWQARQYYTVQVEFGGVGVTRPSRRTRG